ncbi:uncharacterized protein ATNIH1004_006734 [Aspergillus tanneri]|uniref:DUF7703 domain-containing protein n=1 Tax=Aspergillus tanneri TaxID=1220188 RepID=A0A5M9MEB3_9EURO|nr:uncharacterized protein ATNIH1004_006734 [Aspergillus tanneri]KAA8645315.1 hypothetical protein ATNIH1004_006734 [Aspergillus tanneri]
MVGETGPVALSRAKSMLIAAFFALSCYNVLEISITIFSTFKRRRGLYFCSMLVATWGILLHSIAVFLRFFALAPNFPMCVLTVLGWYAMVTGQSVVLYSRLHLVSGDTRCARWVLYMIIMNFCILHIPVTILFLGSNLDDRRFAGPFNIYEKIQLAGFCIQEIIISGLYIWEASTALRPVLAVKGKEGQYVWMHLILVNIVVILLDASLLATEYTNNFEVQTTYKPVVYSIKLKMEFSVLNRLISVIRTGPSIDDCVVTPDEHAYSRHGSGRPIRNDSVLLLNCDGDGAQGDLGLPAAYQHQPTAPLPPIGDDSAQISYPKPLHKGR